MEGWFRRRTIWAYKSMRLEDCFLDYHAFALRERGFDYYENDIFKCETEERADCQSAGAGIIVGGRTDAAAVFFGADDRVMELRRGKSA